MSHLPANLWGLHPLYLADVPLFAAHLARHLCSSPQLPRDSHYLSGAHPLRSVEVSGVVTLVTRKSGGKLDGEVAVGAVGAWLHDSLGAVVASSESSP